MDLAIKCQDFFTKRPFPGSRIIEETIKIVYKLSLTSKKANF